MSQQRFPSPFEVPTPEGCEGWEKLYPYYYLFSEDRREFEESKFWFFDSMHHPEVLYPFDTITSESWWVALGEMNSLHDTVRFPGYCSPREVQTALAKADAFVLPVGWDPILKIPEGVPVALMEAMAVGIPVVSGRTAGIPELIADGITGFLANPGDPSDLAEVVARLFSLSNEDRGSLTLAARQKIVSEHDIVALTRDLHVSLTRCARSHV